MNVPILLLFISSIFSDLEGYKTNVAAQVDCGDTQLVTSTIVLVILIWLAILTLVILITIICLIARRKRNSTEDKIRKDYYKRQTSFQYPPNL